MESESTDLGPVAMAQAHTDPLPIAKAPPLAYQREKKRFGKITVGGFFDAKIFTFRPNELRFLKEYGPETSIEDAAKKAGLSVQFAEKMLRRKSVQEFLQDKFQQIAIQNGWTVERWFAEGDKVWQGKRFVTREQLDIWKEFGARILPKARSAGGGDANQDKPQITINIGAVDEAFKRQQSIQAELLQGSL